MEPVAAVDATTGEEVEHVDVLIVGAGISGISAACHLRERCPGKSFAILEARDAIGGTWDLFRYPGIRSDSDMYTLGFSFRPWEQPEAIAAGRRRSSTTSAATAEEYDIDRRDPLPPSRRRAEWSTPRRAGRVEVERDRRRRRDRDDRSPADSSAAAPATTATTRATRPEFAGTRRLRGHDRPPAALARGPRLRRQADRRDRQRRHRGDAGPGAERAGRARDDAAALADLHRLAARPATASRSRCGGGCRREPPTR